MINKFPNKPIPLVDVITAFGISTSDLPLAIDQILLKLKYGELDIYFNENIIAHDDSDIENVLDVHGNFQATMVNSGHVNFEDKQLKLIKGAYEYIRSNHYINIHGFDSNNKEYFPVDDTGMWSIPYPLHYNSFYCNGSDLNRLLNSKKSSTTKKVPILERREEVLRSYLKKEAIRLNITANTYKEIHLKLGEPTRAHLLKNLNLLDPVLFPTNEDTQYPQRDFWANQSVFRFKDGTGKGRITLI